MGDKQEMFKFYKLAQELALKEFGNESYLSKTINERIQSASCPPTVSTNANTETEPVFTLKTKYHDKLLKKKLNRLMRQRRNLRLVNGKHIHMSSLAGKSLQNINFKEASYMDFAVNNAYSKVKSKRNDKMKTLANHYDKNRSSQCASEQKRDNLTLSNSRTNLNYSEASLSHPLSIINSKRKSARKHSKIIKIRSRRK